MIKITINEMINLREIDAFVHQLMSLGNENQVIKKEEMLTKCEG
jgi:hypothetical protein